MNKKEILKNYLEVLESSTKKDKALSDALLGLNTDNYLVSTIPIEYEKFVTSILGELVGDEAVEWIHWWFYDAEQKPSKVWINDVEFTITSYEDLWRIVLNNE